MKVHSTIFIHTVVKYIYIYIQYPLESTVFTCEHEYYIMKAMVGTYDKCIAQKQVQTINISKTVSAVQRWGPRELLSSNSSHLQYNTVSGRFHIVFTYFSTTDLGTHNSEKQYFNCHMARTNSPLSILCQVLCKLGEYKRLIDLPQSQT